MGDYATYLVPERCRVDAPEREELARRMVGWLQDKGWIEALPVQAGSRKKEYRITAAGKAAVEAELARLEELVKNGRVVTKEGQA